MDSGPQLQHRIEYFVHLAMELHKRRAFSAAAATTSATSNKLCDQKVTTRTARWFASWSCAKMEDRTE